MKKSEIRNPKSETVKTPPRSIANQPPQSAPPKKKSCFNFRNCCFCCLGMFITLIILILILLALSGLVRLPLLSPLLYGDGPKPSRVVALQSVDDKYVENLFKTAADKNQNQVVITEGVLSFLINKSTAGSQLAVDEASAELFYRPQSPKTTLTIKIIPSNSGYKAQKIKIGKLRTPVFAANFFFARYLSFNAMYGSTGVKKIELQKGQVVITIDPEFFKENSQEAPVPFAPQ